MRAGRLKTRQYKVRRKGDWPLLLAAGGSWTVPAKEINAGNFEKITELCAEARRIVDEVRAK